MPPPEKGGAGGPSQPEGTGTGDSYEDALSDVKSAIHFHIESFGDAVLDSNP